MLKAIIPGALLGAVATFALFASGAQSQSGPPCTPKFAGANTCATVTIDAAGTPTFARARFNGTYDASCKPVFVSTTNAKYGNAVLGFVDGEQRVTFSAPTNNDQSALQGKTVGYKVDVQGTNSRNAATVYYKTVSTDSPSVAVQQGDFTISFANHNNVAGDDVPVPVTKTGFKFEGTEQGDFIRTGDPVPDPDHVC